MYLLNKLKEWYYKLQLKYLEWEIFDCKEELNCYKDTKDFYNTKLKML